MGKEKKQLVPELRFGEFEGEWEERTIESNYSLISGTHLGPNQYYSKSFIGSIPYFTGPSDFTNEEEQLSKWTENNGKSAIKGDILFTVKGSGVSSSMMLTLEKVAIGRQLMAIRSAEASTSFLFSKLSTLSNLYVALASGNMIPGLSRSDILKTKIFFPNLSEQQKIAIFLTAVDQKIQQLQRKKALLAQYKIGAMQQLFTQQLRFKQADGSSFPDWEEKLMGDVGTTFNGLTGKTKEDFGIGYPFITYKQIFDDSRIDLNRSGLVSIEENENQSKVAYGDVFFTTSSETRVEVGFASVLLDKPESVYLNSFCFGFRLNSHKEFAPEYARYLFRSHGFRKEITKLGQGSTRYNMSKIGMKKILIQLPCLDEQQKIATYLTRLDTQLEHLTQQITQTQTFKKGLLQKLFV